MPNNCPKNTALWTILKRWTQRIELYGKPRSLGRSDELSQISAVSVADLLRSWGRKRPVTMSRALRIQVANGWYHVANRGAGRQRVFRNEHHRSLFLELLGSLVDDFDLEVHCYCLMSNRYDLIVRTLLPNLSLAMRQLNGVYTQRFNRLVNRDGSLFRGRYRAILFEESTCLLPLTRYLHRRPLATGMVPRLDRYRWSSYPTFVTRRKYPNWLNTGTVLDHLDETAGRALAYRRYVEAEGNTSPLIRAFYRSRRPGSILGSPEFQSSVLAQLVSIDQEVPAVERVPTRPSAVRIMEAVAGHFEVPVSRLLESKRGRLNTPRLAAVWLCRHRGRLQLNDLAQQFGLASYGSASSLLHRIRTQMRPPFWRHISAIEELL